MNRMQAKKILSNQDGSVLVLALIILVLLTLMGLSAINTSTIEIKIAANEKRYKMVLYAADAGIEAGRATLDMLKDADTGNWDNLIQGIPLVGQGGFTTLNQVIGAAGLKVGPSEFSLAVRDNNDLDGESTVDTDNIVILTSTGTYDSTRTVVEAYVRYTGGGDEYAQEHYDAASSGQAGGGAVQGSSRW